MDKMLCLNLMCSVYVFGASSDKCPECGGEGKKMVPEQTMGFMRWYQKVVNS